MGIDLPYVTKGLTAIKKNLGYFFGPLCIRSLDFEVSTYTRIVYSLGTVANESCTYKIQNLIQTAYFKTSGGVCMDWKIECIN